jgi:hypothetical protein
MAMVDRQIDADASGQSKQAEYQRVNPNPER